MLDNLITSNKLYKLLTSQPYFVWNSLDDVSNEADDLDSYQFDFPSFIDNPNDLEEYGVSFTQIQLASFELIKEEYKKWLQKRFGDFYELKSKTFEDKVSETEDIIKNKKAKFIFNPSFVYEFQEHNALAVPSLYDIERKILYFNKNSSSTKRKDIIKILFDYNIIKKLGYEVNDIALHIFATKDYKKNQIDFFETKYINTSTASRSNSDARKSFDFVTLQTFKAGTALSQKTGDPIEKNSLFEIVSSNELEIKPPSKKKEAEVFPFYDLDNYLEKIITAKKVNSIHYPTQKDNTSFGFNSQWNELIAEEASGYSGYNGKIISKQSIINSISLNELRSGSPLINLQLNSSKPIINDLFRVETTLARLAKKIVWYDFEAFSLPIAPLDSVLPYNQVVSQVSVVVTDNEKEVFTNNLVLDPKNYVIDDFVKLIDAVYRPGHEYVVYNKGYENARWNEMVRLLNKVDHPQTEYVSKRVDEIIDHTIDLADMFIVTSKKTLPVILIPELKFKHSIKLLEKYITNHAKHLPYKIKEYKNLDVKQGMMAMEIANYRALNIIGDAEWSLKVKQLQEYCENDVKAMIMVYYLIKNIFNKNKEQ